MATALLYVLLALGLNLIVGYAGLLDLGYVAFYAVGAITSTRPSARRWALSRPMVNS